MNKQVLKYNFIRNMLSSKRDAWQLVSRRRDRYGGSEGGGDRIRLEPTKLKLENRSPPSDYDAAPTRESLPKIRYKLLELQKAKQRSASSVKEPA